MIFRDPQGWTAFFSYRPYEVGVRSLYQLMDLETDYLLLNESLGDDRPPVPFGAKQRASAVGQALARVASKYEITI